MSQMQIIKNELKKFQVEELIFASSLYRKRLEGRVNELTYYKCLERLVADGTLSKAARGVYYFPYTFEGRSFPIKLSGIEKSLTDDESGMPVGYALYNKLGLTTQVPFQREYLTSQIEGDRKQIGKCTAYRLNVKFDKQTVDILSSLEVLEHYKEIPDLDEGAFMKFTKTVASSFDEKALGRLLKKRRYKKSTIAFLRNVLNFYHIKNELNEYLSELSIYDIPKMEDIYESASNPVVF